MSISFFPTRSKLTFWGLLSSMAVVFAVTSARAHELQPTVADLSLTPDRTVELVLRLNLEAFLAGIDLDGLEDTDDTDQSDDYDALRALSGPELAARLPELLEIWNGHPLLSTGQVPLALSSEGVDVPEVPNEELPRLAVWTLTADLPLGAGGVLVSWPDGAGAMVLRQQGVDEPFTGYLSGGDTSPEIDLGGGGAQTLWQAFISYIPVGFDHILPKGLDHILFVLGLFFLSAALRPLIWQISAFTLAHTVTLALGALGWVSIPGAIVEPLIAASIVYVAVENIFAKGLNPWRPMVIFGFGLLHGLGFASVLGAFGLPAGQFVPALIGFNIGVELGQLTVIALAFVAVGWFARRPWYRARIAIPASVAIAAVGAYWFIERVFL